MRIATWNLEHPDPKDTVLNLARMEKIREIEADIWILTETHEVIDLSATHHGSSTLTSPRKPRSGEACVAVWSRRQGDRTSNKDWQEKISEFLSHSHDVCSVSSYSN